MMMMVVDTAVTVPVNYAALVDDTDFKTREESVTFDQSGLDLVWNFVTPAGVITQTAVTPTDTAGVYDWTNVGNGMYKIEIPASGGGTINNDTEGYGWFTGFATGILPWAGPIITFAPANVVNALVTGSDTLQVDPIEIMGTILTEGGAGRLAAAFIKLFDVATPTLVASDVMRGTDNIDVIAALEDAGLVLETTTIATLASQTSFTLTAGSADPGAYERCIAVVESASTPIQKALGLIQNYAAARTITLTVDPAIFTMAVGDKVSIIPVTPALPNRISSKAFGLPIVSLQIPFANADAAGGLPISIAGSLDLDAKLANTNEITAARMAVLTAAMSRAVDAIGIGTVGSGSTTTNIVTSSLTPAATVADQFKGRILTFPQSTTTVNLRNQGANITANTTGASAAFTVPALTTAPVSGDIFTIQ